MKNSAVILLSGGLDSYAALDIAKNNYEILLSLTFNYGQEAFEDEKNASLEIARKYGIEHKIVELPFLSEIKGDDVWIPNRNGLFINIAGSFCDFLKCNTIIFGANREEARDFSDNKKEFIEKMNETLSYSTKCRAQVFSPLVDMDKVQIVEYCIKNNLDFSLIKSCYNSKNKTGKKHCGVCSSCVKLKNSLIKLKREDILEKLDF